MNNATVCCPKCAGYTELDDEGCAYTCYFCCDSGRVPQEVAEHFYRAELDDAEQFAPKHLGIFIRPMQSEYDFSDDDAEPADAGHRLFTRLIQNAPAYRRGYMSQAAYAEFCGDDASDIPF